MCASRKNAHNGYVSAADRSSCWQISNSVSFLALSFLEFSAPLNVPRAGRHCGRPIFCHIAKYDVSWRVVVHCAAHPAVPEPQNIKESLPVKIYADVKLLLTTSTSTRKCAMDYDTTALSVIRWWRHLASDV